MSKHTPGPWEVEYDGINKFIKKQDSTDIAEIFEQSNPDTAHHNARLMATAPELLEALQKAIIEMEGLPHSLGYEFTHLKEMRAIVAKATGVAK